MSSIKRLVIEGLHGQLQVDIGFPHNISIFMGPNGVGKSTILNIFVHFASRQWSRLSKHPFVRASLEFPNGEVVSVDRADCADSILTELSPRIRSAAIVLSEAGVLHDVIEGNVKDIPAVERMLSGTMYGGRDLSIVQANLLQYGDAINSIARLSRTSNAIKRNFQSKIVYLPTYRRIEQDISEIFSISSASMRRFQAEIAETIDMQTEQYVELVRFGMEDITRLIDRVTSAIKEYSRQQVNSLSISYLTVVLQPRQTFQSAFFASLTDSGIKEILARVDDKQLNPQQRNQITGLIKDLRSRAASPGRLTRQQEQLAAYFPLLAATHDRISEREKPLQQLAQVLNKYIQPTKTASYDKTTYEFNIKTDIGIIPLQGLSSGEKQIVSLFATLMLSDDADLFIVVDEPELSLSVLWQELLVEDLMAIPRCKSLLAVTHSPFIYGERLAQYTRDMSDFTEVKS